MLRPYLGEKILTWGHGKFHIHTKDDNYNHKVLIITSVLWEYGSPEHNYNDNDTEEQYR